MTLSQIEAITAKYTTADSALPIPPQKRQGNGSQTTIAQTPECLSRKSTMYQQQVNLSMRDDHAYGSLRDKTKRVNFDLDS